MRLRRLSWMCLLLLAVPAFGQKIKVDYNKSIDFSRYKTYSWLMPKDPARPFVAMDIVGATDDELKARGLTKTPSGGDLIVSAYGSLDEGVNVSYDVDIYAMPGLDGNINWANGTPRPGNSSAVYIDKGTLVIDLADRASKQLVWRGIAKANLDPQKQEKSMETIEKSIAKMFKQYPVKN